MRLLVTGKTDCGATDIRPTLPPMTLHAQTPPRPTADDLREWCAVTAACRATPIFASVVLLSTRSGDPPRPGLCIEKTQSLDVAAVGWKIIEGVAVCPGCCAAGVRLGIFRG